MSVQQFNYTATSSSSKTATPVLIDYRSDTVTVPTEAMRGVMAKAEVGDDVYGEDPSVNKLEEKVAGLLGKEAGLFLPSGTMSNLCAMLSHCQRGEEVITGDQYHVHSHEAGGASVLGGIAMQALPTDSRGGLSLEQVEAAIRPDDSHCPISRLISLENTVSGRVQDQVAIDRISAMAHSKGLSVHMDGARLLNAAVAQKTSPADLVDNSDSVSLCLSKGLGAPAGSVLSGSNEIIKRARRIRKLLGGGMRQAGVLAACGIYALDYHVERLQEDHDNTRRLAEGLAAIDAIGVDLSCIDTNILFITLPQGDEDALRLFLADNGVKIQGQRIIRMVVHMGITRNNIDRTLMLFQQFYQ